MTEYSFIVDVKPAVKQRPRLGRRGRVFTPEATLLAEQVVREAYDGPLFEGPVAIQIHYGSDHTSIHIESVEGWENESRLRGDIDNYVKLTLDGLNGVAFTDDKQVVEVYAWKA